MDMRKREGRPCEAPFLARGLHNESADSSPLSRVPPTPVALSSATGVWTFPPPTTRRRTISTTRSAPLARVL